MLGGGIASGVGAGLRGIGHASAFNKHRLAKVENPDA